MCFIHIGLLEKKIFWKYLSTNKWMKTWGIRELKPHCKDLFIGHDSSHLCVSNKTVTQRRWTQGKNGSHLQGVYHSFCNFWYSKQNHSGNTNTIVLKAGGGKKKVAQASSDLSTFSDLSSQIWFLPQIQLAANYLCLLFSEKELWSSCSSTSCSYSVSPRKVPQAPQELQGLPFPGEPCWGQPGPSGNCPLTISGGKDGNNHSSNTQRTQQCKN